VRSLLLASQQATFVSRGANPICLWPSQHRAQPACHSWASLAIGLAPRFRCFDL